MNLRLTLRLAALVQGVAVVCLASGVLFAQTRAAAAPRTPWGDPDLQGTYTNTYEASTPFERPDQFAGRRLEDIKGEELAKVRLAIQERTIGRLIRTPTAASTTAASPAACPARCCRQFTATSSRSSRAPASSRSATR